MGGTMPEPLPPPEMGSKSGLAMVAAGAALLLMADILFGLDEATNNVSVASIIYGSAGHSYDLAFSLVGVAAAGLAVFAGVINYFEPVHHRLTGAILVILAAVLSIPTTFGGFFLGALFLFIAAALMIEWKPTPPPAPASPYGPMPMFHLMPMFMLPTPPMMLPPAPMPVPPPVPPPPAPAATPPTPPA